MAHGESSQAFWKLTMIALWANVAAWIAVLAVTSPGTWRLMRGKGGDHDAIKFSYFAVSVVILAFNIRWIVAPESEFALELLRVFSIALALFLMVIVRFYHSAR